MDLNENRKLLAHDYYLKHGMIDEVEAGYQAGFNAGFDFAIECLNSPEASEKFRLTMQHWSQHVKNPSPRPREWADWLKQITNKP